MGEVVAWIIGWDLILEYGISVAAVAVGWGGNLNSFLDTTFGVTIPTALSTSPETGGTLNLPAVLITVIVTALLMRGVRETTRTNTIMVFVKLAVLLLFILASGYGFHLPELAIYPLAFATLLVFTLALTFWLAALNVRYRDIQHLLNIALLVWFWMTPIVYSGFLVKDVLKGRKVLGVSLWGLYLANPLASIAMGFQRALYGVVRPVVGERPVLPDVSLAWLAGVLATVLAASLVFLLYTWRRFFELSGDFAEEL